MIRIKAIKQLTYLAGTTLFALFISYLISSWIHNPLSDKVVTLYYADNITEAHQEIIDRFNQEHRDKIKVVAINLPFSKFSTNERKELLARTLRSQSDKLDIFAADVIWIPRFAKWVEPLDKYFNPTEKERYSPNVLSFCKVDSKLVAIPLYTDLMHIYYRRDLISKMADGKEIEKKLANGISWKELIAISKKYPVNNSYSFIFPGKNFEGLMCLYLANLYSLNGRFVMDNKLFPEPDKAVQAGNILVDLVKKYRVSPPVVCRLDEYSGYQYAAQQNSLFFVGWPGLVEQREKELHEMNLSDKYAMAPLPRFSDGREIAIFGGWNLMVSKNSKHKKEAVEFIRFTSQLENQKILHLRGGFLPINKKVYEDSSFVASNKNLSFYLLLSKQGKSRPTLIHYTQISDIFTNYLHLAIKGEISVSEALKRTKKELVANQISLE